MSKPNFNNPTGPQKNFYLPSQVPEKDQLNFDLAEMDTKKFHLYQHPKFLFIYNCIPFLKILAFFKKNI
jgi:hypothetical protein